MSLRSIVLTVWVLCAAIILLRAPAMIDRAHAHAEKKAAIERCYHTGASWQYCVRVNN